MDQDKRNVCSDEYAFVNWCGTITIIFDLEDYDENVPQTLTAQEARQFATYLADLADQADEVTLLRRQEAQAKVRLREGAV